MADSEINQWNEASRERLREREQELLAALNALAGEPNDATRKQADKALQAFLVTLAGKDVPLPEGWRFADSN